MEWAKVSPGVCKTKDNQYSVQRMGHSSKWMAYRYLTPVKACRTMREGMDYCLWLNDDLKRMAT
jgi:actin-like ATPase involved in cell morphogenesis